MKKRLITILVTAALIVASFAPATFAASKGTKKMTVYNTIKNGNVVYCSDRLLSGVYKIDLSTKGVAKIASEYGEWMRLHKGYLYYYHYYGYNSKLSRINLSNNKASTVFKCNGRDIHYAISKSKIYTSYESAKNGKTKRKVMKLSGKSKKSSKTKVRMTEKATNADGYFIKVNYTGGYEDGDYYDDLYYSVYFVTPAWNILLEKGKSEDVE